MLYTHDELLGLDQGYKAGYRLLSKVVFSRHMNTFIYAVISDIHLVDFQPTGLPNITVPKTSHKRLPIHELISNFLPHLWLKNN